MFAPSFFTRPLIRRVGPLPVMFTGSLFAIAVALSGISVAHIRVSLVLIGVGWNFLYIGGTSLLTGAYRAEEQAKAQGANDQTIFMMMALSSFASGLTVTAAAWTRVNLVAMPLVPAVAATIVWYALHERMRRAAAGLGMFPPALVK